MNDEQAKFLADLPCPFNVEVRKPCAKSLSLQLLERGDPLSREAGAFISNARGISNYMEHEFGWRMYDNIAAPTFTSDPEEWTFRWKLRRRAGKVLLRWGFRLCGWMTS